MRTEHEEVIFTLPDVVQQVWMLNQDTALYSTDISEYSYERDVQSHPTHYSPHNSLNLSLEDPTNNNGAWWYWSYLLINWKFPMMLMRIRYSVKFWLAVDYSVKSKASWLDDIRKKRKRIFTHAPLNETFVKVCRDLMWIFMCNVRSSTGWQTVITEVVLGSFITCAAVINDNTWQGHFV